MIQFLKQKNNKKGFTLIETLIALSIFIVSVVGIMSVLASGLTDINFAKKKTTATFLAQEGIEYVRNFRDTYVLYSNLPSIVSWNNFITKFIPCMGVGCYLNNESLDYSITSQITDLDVIDCVSACPYIKYNETTGRYNSGGTGVATSFRRTITLKKIGLEEAKITSTVSWGTGNSNSVTLTENLFNWY